MQIQVTHPALAPRWVLKKNWEDAHGGRGIQVTCHKNVGRMVSPKAGKSCQQQAHIVKNR